MGGLRRVDKACNIRPTAKSTDFTKKKELWKVFRKNPKELFAYTVRGEGEDEEEATEEKSEGNNMAAMAVGAVVIIGVCGFVLYRRKKA